LRNPGAPIHENLKQALIRNDERQTDLIFRSYRNTERVAHNAISEEVLSIEREGKPFEAVAHLVRRARGREALENGDIDGGVWSAGLGQGLIHDAPSVKELVTRIVAEAETIIRGRLADLLSA
jgi:nitronate monooxygenase